MQQPLSDRPNRKTCLAAIAAADASEIATYLWKDRGRAPRSYLRGMATGFSRAMAKLARGDEALHVATGPLGADDHDVLSWYRSELAAASAPLDGSPLSRLVCLFTIMLGLGMRESSGRHCEGLDKDALAPPTAFNAEAGLFQVSFDSLDGDRARQRLFDVYRDRSDLLDVFSVNIRCSAYDWTNVPGDSEGVAFQTTMKRCPEFAMLYTAMLLRTSVLHWGPLQYREVECLSGAVNLFEDLTGR